MQTHPQQRFVKLRHGAAEHQNATTTFLGVHTEPQPTVENHAVLNGIAQTDSDRASLIQQRMAELVSHNDTVMAWLEADPANVALFSQDPVAALRKVIPDLPDDFFKGWGTYPQPTS